MPYPAWAGHDNCIRDWNHSGLQMLQRNISPEEGAMYLLIELFSAAMAYLGRDVPPADAKGDGYHISSDAMPS